MKRASLAVTLSAALCCSLFATLVPITPVGYINILLRPGFNLISIPLKMPNSEIAEVFGAGHDLPDGLTIYIMENGQFYGTTYSASAGQFEPSTIARKTIPPGRAFFVYNPLQSQLTLAFAGEIPTGQLTNSLPDGFSAVAPMIPRSGTLSAHGFPTAPRDVIYFWDATNQVFRGSTFDDIDGAWLSREESVSPGEGFILFKREAVDWIIDFELQF